MRFLFCLIPVLLFAQEKPFHAMGRYDHIGYSNIENRHAHGQIKFSVAEAELGSAVWSNPCVKEYFDLTAGYLYTKLNWTRNPYFDQQDYDTVTLRLATLTHRLRDWEWTAYIKAYLDINHVDFQHYLYWDFLFWGRYHLCGTLNVSIGLFGELGMKDDHLYPVIGVDWFYNECVKINLIFPFDMSIVYRMSPCWEAGLVTKFFRQRHRVGRDEPLERGMWEYTNIGTEFGVNYKRWDRFILNLHAGWAWGGRLRIDNSHRRDAHHLTFCGAPYVGGETNLRF